MKNKRFIGLGLLLLTMASLSFSTKTTTVVSAEETLNPVNIYFFHVDGCSHCADEAVYLEQLVEEKTNVTIVSYNIADSESYTLLNEAADAFGETTVLTPFTVLGGKHYVGFNDAVEASILKNVTKYSANDYIDVMAKIIAGEPLLESDFDTSSDYVFTLPWIGEVDIRGVSIFLIAIVLGFVDGVNPCAMWVLIFLISMLIATDNKKRVWILGGSFLLTSAIFYFFVMIAWLKTVEFVAAATVFQIIIGSFALLAGAFNLYSFVKAKVKKEDGCEVTDVKQKKRLVDRIRSIASANRFAIALIGVMGLAVIVNLIELACSTGLPVLFMQILALNGITGGAAIFYILIYILFFLIDDIIVFSISVLTFKVSPLSAKIGKYSHLIGGILMLIIGILMIFFPSILRFAF